MPIRINNIVSTIDISTGDNTHHHDQAIYPVNFKPIKSIVSKLVKPIPLEDEVELLILISFQCQE